VAAGADRHRLPVREEGPDREHVAAAGGRRLAHDDPEVRGDRHAPGGQPQRRRRGAGVPPRDRHRAKGRAAAVSKERWATRLRSQPKFQLHTSLDPALSCAIGTIGIDGIPPGDITSKLFNQWRIIATPIGHAEYQGIRVTPNVYTTLEEIDTFGDAMEQIAKGA